MEAFERQRSRPTTLANPSDLVVCLDSSPMRFSRTSISGRRQLRGWVVCSSAGSRSGPTNIKAISKILLIIGAGCAAVLVPYAYLLSKRSHTMDDVQLLVRTHAPDLTRFPEYIAGLVILIVFFGISIRRLELRSPSVVFVSRWRCRVCGFQSAGNDGTVPAADPLPGLHRKLCCRSGVGIRYRTICSRSRVAASGIAAKAVFGAWPVWPIGWGFVECHYTVRVLDDANVARDEQVPLGRRLTELSKNDPTNIRPSYFIWDRRGR